MSRKISNLMSEYFDISERNPEISEIVFGMSKDPCPIKASQDNWTVAGDPKKLVRDFDFYDFKEMKNFLNELLDYQEHVQHHAEITVDHRVVRVEIYTKDLEEITELDKEYASFADMIFRDVKDYGN